MDLYRVTIPKDSDWQVLEMLGDMGLAHFINMNREENNFNLPNSQRISQCDETERKINYLLQECQAKGVKLRKPRDKQHFEEKTHQIKQDRRTERHLLFDKIKEEVDETEKFARDQAGKIKGLNNGLDQMKDEKRVLEFVKDMFKIIEKLDPESN